VEADAVEEIGVPVAVGEDARDRAPAGAAGVEERAVDVEEENGRGQTPSSRAMMVS
jgi:hypothetical protein